MSRMDVYGMPPGVTAAVETYEAAFTWGSRGQGRIAGGLIDAGATDPTNGSTTFELRPGLLMGQKTANGAWTNYSPTATDGSEVATGVMLVGLRMTDIFSQSGVARFYGILVGGPVQAAKLIGLDQMARQQMGNTFWFDDPQNYPGNHWYPWKRFQTKTTSYAVTVADNNSLFDNTGAGAPVTFTLPAIAPGLMFGFRGVAAQNFAVTSFEGTNIIALNNASASTLTFSTGGQIIGAMLTIFSNPAGTKWIASNDSAGSAAITVS